MEKSNTTVTTSFCTGFSGAVGNTPLILLRNLSRLTGCNILVKAEFMNPGGSVKDRAALSIIRDGQKRGILKEGTWIVEATAGNTGVALAHLASEFGYRCLFTVPASVSQEKVDLLRTLGAEVEVCPIVPSTDPRHFQAVARQRAQELGGLFTNQFDNEANFEAHFTTTGPELWSQCGGKIDAFVSVCGTGGTLAGTTNFLKQQDPNLLCILVDPAGSGIIAENDSDNSDMTLKLRQRTPEEKSGNSIMEGIGSGRLYGNLARAKIDGYLVVSDQIAMDMANYVRKHEGLFVGGSTGLNIAAAYYIAKRLGPGHTVVTVVCDTGDRYISKLYSKSYLEEQGIEARVPDNLDFEPLHQCFNSLATRKFSK